MDEKKGNKDAFGQQIRDTIQRNIEKAEATHKRNFFRRRIEIAKRGITSLEQERFSDAVASFKSYLKTLEDWKSVPEGGLNPSYFDREKDAAELILISGIYWDLVKLYDRTKSHINYDEFLFYLDKFVLFTKGMSYEAVCAETLRKYIYNNKCVHVREFRAAYRRLVGSPNGNCFIATALADVCDPATLPSLRRFRDERLLRSRPGALFVRFYYQVGPSIARVVENAPEPVRRWAASVLDRLARSLS